MKTTFGKIKSFEPSEYNWNKLMKLNHENDMNKEITILEILNRNGVEAAFWALRTQDYRDYCLILVDVAESVLHIFEEKYPEDKRPRAAIDALRLWYSGQVTETYLTVCSTDAVAAVEDANAAAVGVDNAAADAHYIYAACRAARSVYAATGHHHAHDVSGSAYATAFTAANAAYYAAEAGAAYDARAAQWEKNEEILRKYLEATK